MPSVLPVPPLPCHSNSAQVENVKELVSRDAGYVEEKRPRETDKYVYDWCTEVVRAMLAGISG